MLPEMTEFWFRRFEAEKGVVWRHSGNARQPHPKLASDRHANVLFNTGPIIANKKLADQAVANLIEMLDWEPPVGKKRYIIVGPARGATKLAELLSNEAEKCFGGEWFSTSPTKAMGGEQKIMVFSPEERLLLPESYVAPCEDVITTGDSVRRAAIAARKAGATILPFVLALVNRSGCREIDGREIIALIESSEPTWPADDCPFCAQGSEAIDPNGDENWARLSAPY